MEEDQGVRPALEDQIEGLMKLLGGSRRDAIDFLRAAIDNPPNPQRRAVLDQLHAAEQEMQRYGRPGADLNGGDG